MLTKSMLRIVTSFSVPAAAFAGLVAATPVMAASVGCLSISTMNRTIGPNQGPIVVPDNFVFDQGDVINWQYTTLDGYTLTVNGTQVVNGGGRLGTPNGSGTVGILTSGVTPIALTIDSLLGPGGTATFTCTPAPPPPPNEDRGGLAFIAVFEPFALSFADREPVRTEEQKKLIVQFETERAIEAAEGYLQQLRNEAANPDMSDEERAQEVRDFREKREQLYRQLGRTPPPLPGYDDLPPVVTVSPGGGIDAPDESILDQIPDGLPVINYAARRQSPIDPSLGAISQFFDHGGRAFTGSAPLQSPIPGWRFGAILDGGIIERTFGALQSRTFVGSLTITGSTTIEETILGLGLKLGTGAGTISPSGDSLSALQLGGDLHVMKWLDPGLLGSLYGGYEIGLNNSMFSGVASQFLSHTFKAGAGLRGVIALDEVTLSPALSALLQYQHVPSFTDGAGVAVAAFHALDLNVTGGVTISRSFDLVEPDATAVPFLTLNGVLDYRTTSLGTSIPTDAFSLQAVGGVRLDWNGGASITLQGDITAGATTTMYGASASLKVPLR